MEKGRVSSIYRISRGVPMLDLLNACGVPAFDMVRYGIDINENKSFNGSGGQA